MSAQRPQDAAHPRPPKRRDSFRRLEQKIRPHVPSLRRQSTSTRGDTPQSPPQQDKSRSSRRWSIIPADSDSEPLYTSLLRSKRTTSASLANMPKANNLSINVPSGTASPIDPALRSGLTSPRTPLTPRSPPVSGSAQYGDGYENHLNSPINALPPPPASPRSPKPGSSSSVTAKIFGNKLASKSATKLSSRHYNSHAEYSPSRSPAYANNAKSGVYLNASVGGNIPGGGAAANKSSPDVSVSHPHSGQSSPGGGAVRERDGDSGARDHSRYSSSRHNKEKKTIATAPPNFFQSTSTSTVSTPISTTRSRDKFNPLICHPVADFSPDTLKSSSTLPTSTSHTQEKEKSSSSRKTQHKFGNFLNRKSSLRGDEPTPSLSSNEPLPTEQHHQSRRAGEKEKPIPKPIKAVSSPIDVPVRTAPVEKERGFRSAMNSALRNRSLDRADTTSPSNDAASERMSSSHGGGASTAGHAHKPSSLGPNGSVMSGIRSGGTRAAEGINKARKGLFGGLGKLGRSGSSSHESRESVLRNEPYELKVLILPLEEQARVTRIAKRLHYCKDKTEFWLPAFPYRCIDYLSDRGTYSEGLYRVPGSELEIKHYMARFDREHDIDLFDCEDLHDVNVVATMLKRWLSNLPPVLPPSTQSAIITHCSESHPAVPGGTTPPFMKEQLSNLPPWNYYLLFAITGHISFLHNHREQNKMTYENLFRCFATRALQVEPYIFWWLVWDWRGCWAGCAREDEFKVREYEVLDRMQQEEEERGRPAAGAVKGVEKKDSKEADVLRGKEKEKRAGKQHVSALSKQSVSSREREKKERPKTSHSHSQSSVSVSSRGGAAGGQGHPPPMPSRTRSPPKEKASTIKPVQPSDERSREREREKERERNERALSSSGSSKPSITGQSSAGMTDEDHHPQTHAAENGATKEAPKARKREEVSGEDGERLKSTDMGLPMLSPLKPLSPFGLH